MKKHWSIAGLSAALAVGASTVSFALEEQKGTVAPETPAAAAAQPSAAPAISDKGTEIRIPGIGKLGTLPKMDFGLELLYGATESDRPKEPSKIEDNTNEGTTIRGEIKHRF